MAQVLDAGPKATVDSWGLWSVLFLLRALPDPSFFVCHAAIQLQCGQLSEGGLSTLSHDSTLHVQVLCISKSTVARMGQCPPWWTVSKYILHLSPCGLL